MRGMSRKEAPTTRIPGRRYRPLSSWARLLAFQRHRGWARGAFNPAPTCGWPGLRAGAERWESAPGHPLKQQKSRAWGGPWGGQAVMALKVPARVDAIPQAVCWRGSSPRPAVAGGFAAGRAREH